MAEFKGKQGHWVSTESGSHIFIEDGGTYEEAVEKAFGKENAKKYKKYEEEKDKEESFDDDYDFDTWGSQAVSVAEEELGINTLDSYENYEQVCDWLMDNGYAEDFNVADKMIKDSLSQEGLDKLNKIREEWGIDDFDSDNEDDWSKWATQTDKSVPKNWTPDGFDGDTRFYRVNNQKGVESVSIKPNGLTKVYTKEGYIDFDSLEQAQNFLNAKTAEEATNIAWDRGWLDGRNEVAISDMFDSDEEFDDSADFDNDLEAAFKKHGPNDDAILDELRANGKDYGMSNGDLQAVVESYTLRHGGQSFISPRRVAEAKRK